MLGAKQGRQLVAVITWLLLITSFVDTPSLSPVGALPLTTPRRSILFVCVPTASMLQHASHAAVEGYCRCLKKAVTSFHDTDGRPNWAEHNDMKSSDVYAELHDDGYSAEGDWKPSASGQCADQWLRAIKFSAR